MRRQTYGYRSGRRRHFPLTGTKLYCSLTEARVWTTCPRLLPDSRLARTQTCDSRVQLSSRYTTSPYTHGWRGEKLKNQLGSCIWPRITHCTAAQFYRSLSWWAWVSHMSLPLCLKRLRNPQNRKCTTYCIVVRGDRATSIGNMDKNLWSLDLCFLRYASGQTYRQLIAVFALLPGKGANWQYRIEYASLEFLQWQQYYWVILSSAGLLNEHKCWKDRSCWLAGMDSPLLTCRRCRRGTVATRGGR